MAKSSTRTGDGDGGDESADTMRGMRLHAGARAGGAALPSVLVPLLLYIFRRLPTRFSFHALRLAASREQRRGRGEREKTKRKIKQMKRGEMSKQLVTSPPSQRFLGGRCAPGWGGEGRETRTPPPPAPPFPPLLLAQGEREWGRRASRHH